MRKEEGMRKAAGLEYEMLGEGEPVLLIHGSHVAGSFLPLTREPVLANHYRLIRYHRRGFAGSDPHAGSFSIEEQARDAEMLLQELGLERAHVVGHSYGGVTALQLTLAAPHAVRSLVLLEPPLMSAESAAATAAAFAPISEAFRAGDARGAVDSFMAAVSGPDWRTAVASRVPGGPEQAERDAATFFEVELPALQNWGFDGDRAGRISQPILYVLGGESGPLFRAPQQLFLASVPHAESVVLPGLDHLLHLRDPAAVARPIANFLARRPPEQDRLG
jgi:pimeloyl-ACP methyl ester carboxylesterase